MECSICLLSGIPQPLGYFSLVKLISLCWGKFSLKLPTFYLLKSWEVLEEGQQTTTIHSILAAEEWRYGCAHCDQKGGKYINVRRSKSGNKFSLGPLSNIKVSITFRVPIFVGPCQRYHTSIVIFRLIAGVVLICKSSDINRLGIHKQHRVVVEEQQQRQVVLLWLAHGGGWRVDFGISLGL